MKIGRLDNRNQSRRFGALMFSFASRFTMVKIKTKHMSWAELFLDSLGILSSIVSFIPVNARTSCRTNRKKVKLNVALYFECFGESDDENRSEQRSMERNEL